MAVDVNLLVNCDDAIVFWRIDKRIKNCWGFSIEREKRLDHEDVQKLILDNRTGFEDDHPQQGEHRPSTVWPFQRFWWADHSANNGDTIRYRVTPMIWSDGELEESVREQSAWTPWTALSGGGKDGYSSFFNRGLVISQFMARYLEELRVKEGLGTRKQALAAFKKGISQHELPIRQFLSGELRTEMLQLLAKTKGQVYAALYELDDEELVTALAQLGRRAHVVLANGSITAQKGEGAAAARKRDQNKEARAALKAKKVEVFDRFISPGALGHNKFLVVAEGGSRPKPSRVWTGSTNWTSTGLCTQINTGLIIDNSRVASEYFKQWERLRDAASGFPKDLVQANSKSKRVKTGKSSAEIWFTRTSKKVDLAAIDDVLGTAADGILFLMFQPGGAATLGTVRKLQQAKKTMYIKGVVSTLPSEEKGESEVDIEIHGASEKKKISVNFDVVQPEGFQTPFANWAATVSRREFITRQGGVIGFAIVHSKLIVVDPFTKPVVIVGSHNFSGSASTKNDENFLIIRGNDELAGHYAAHILSVYQHYRWLAFVKEKQAKGESPGGYLRETDTWQDWHLKGKGKRELDFWFR